MEFQSKIFREYDIRGVYGTDYMLPFAATLGRALARYLVVRTPVPARGRPAYRVAVGRDVRQSGEGLSRALTEALLSAGVDVYDLGVVPTPLVYFSTFHLDVDGAVCITGSHNPAEYNGFKLCVGSSTLHGSEIQELRKLCESGGPSPPRGPGSLTKYDVIGPYQSEVAAGIRLSRPLKVVVDAGNGAAGHVAPKLLSALGCSVIPLFCELDGRFPNHHPDPTVVENLADLRAAVLKNGADLGIAYDGDADRIGAVDEKGNPIFGDELLVLYAREILSRRPGATIISEVKSSNRLYDDIRRHGGKAIMWKTGHSLIKAKMREEQAALAGEMSGHVFFADRYYGYDDAIYASARLLELLSAGRKPLSTLLADLPTSVTTPEIRVDCADEIKFDVVRRVREALASRFKTIDIDGVRIETDKGWGLLRASNTQPVVVMRFEAQSESDLRSIRKTVEDAFEAAKLAVRPAR